MKNKIATKRLNQLKGDQTLKAFADLIGIGQSTLHNYLKGRDMKFSVSAKIAEATGCDLNWLAGIEETNSINLNLILKKNLDELTLIGKKLAGLCFEQKMNKNRAKNHVRGA